MSGANGWERMHRREVLRLAGLGVLAAAAAPLVGCSGSSDGTASPVTVPPTTEPFDPTRPWWLQGGFAPVVDEVETTKLTVQGGLPKALNGLYVRNGSNPRTGASPHWFLGDGMVHGIRLDSGAATSYRNRFVRTPLYESSSGFGSGVPGGVASQSNVSAIWHGGRLLTSGEVGYPYELSPHDLSTTGVHDFAGRLTTSMTAHPKIDPATGRMHFFGYGFVEPYLTYHVAEADGTLVKSTVVPVPGPTMIHDFAITDQDAVFWDLPVVFDLDAAVAMIKDPAGDAFPFRWDPSYGARIGVLPLGADGSEVRWSDIEPCYVFHGVNAFRRGDEVVVDVCRHARMFDKGAVLGSGLALHRWSVDTATGTARDEVVDERSDMELPSRDLRRTGREHRHGYFVQNRERPDTVDLGGAVKHDFTTGRRSVWDPGPSVHSGEWLFVADPDGSADDEGWLLSYVHDESSGESAFTVLDATDVAAGPIATVPLPQRVPYGFHATWVPA
ncbi:MAG: carotenoid oxygenase family protein [Microthrixaceae bacterium]